jgi:hypothetical protein
MEIRLKFTRKMHYDAIFRGAIGILRSDVGGAA